MPESTLSRNDVYNPRPTIRVDGQSNDRVAALVSSMRITEREGGLSALEIAFDNLVSTDSGSEAGFEDESVLKLGAQIAVYGGDETAPIELFRGVITGIEGTFDAESAPRLLVLAEDALQRARLSRKTAIHEDKSLADLANDLANQLGLTPQVTGLSDPLGRLVQMNESDLAFLRRVLSEHDGDLMVIGTELHVAARKDIQRTNVELALYSQLRRARVVADLAHQVTEVTAGGWDAKQGQRVSGTSSGANKGPGSGRLGADVLRDKLAARSEHLRDTPATTDSEAQAIADTSFDKRARRFVVVDGTAEGNPSLRVGTHVKLSGLSKRFDNTYYVVGACHRYDKKRGYETDFQAECAFFGNPS